MFTKHLTSVFFVMFMVATAHAAVDGANGQDAAFTGCIWTGLPKSLNLDNSWTFGGSGNKNGSQVTNCGGLASRVSFVAERTGFEPADQFPGHGFSKPALSTTQPPLQIAFPPCFSAFYVDSGEPVYFLFTTVYTTLTV